MGARLVLGAIVAPPNACGSNRSPALSGRYRSMNVANIEQYLVTAPKREPFWGFGRTRWLVGSTLNGNVAGLAARRSVKRELGSQEVAELNQIRFRSENFVADVARLTSDAADFPRERELLERRERYYRDSLDALPVAIY